MAYPEQEWSMQPPNDDLTCHQVIALLVDYVDGTLPESTALALQEHLADCPECTAFLQTYEATIRLTRSLRQEEIPPEVQRRLFGFLRRTMPSAPPENCQGLSG
jgi:anti-sigma factor (TIGR02949 family)